jgi:hypothetical protein
MSINPWLGGLIALIGAAAASGILGYRTGYDHAVTQARADLATHLERAIAQADEQARQDREVLMASEVRRGRIRTVFETLEKEVIRYATLHVADGDCLSPDGLRLWSHANAGTDPTATPAPADPVPGGAAAPDVGQGAGPAGQSRDQRAPVPLVPGAAAQPRRVGGGGYESDTARPHWGWH